MLTQLSVIDFLNKTAGSEPVPGGGSISALNGAIAASLSEMVARLTIGRKKYAEFEGRMKDLLALINPLGVELVADVDRDSEAYNRVFEAYKLPKDTDEEKAERRDAIQRETKFAAEVPMQVARRVVSMLPYIEEIARSGNQNAVTDAAVAVMCARTAVIGALLNVRINLSSIDDNDFVSRMSEEIADLEAEAFDVEARVLDYVKNVLA